MFIPMNKQGLFAYCAKCNEITQFEPSSVVLGTDNDKIELYIDGRCRECRHEALLSTKLHTMSLGTIFETRLGKVEDE